MKNESPRTIWVIDASYINKCSYKLGQLVDWVLLRRFLERESGALEGFSEAHYLDGVFENAPENLKKFHSFLRSAPPHGPQLILHGYRVKPEPVNCPHCSRGTVRYVQKGVDVGIANLIYTLQDRYDQLVLCAGDADFVDAIKHVRGIRNKVVTVAGYTGSVSTELQSLTNRVIWLDRHWTSFRRNRVA